MKTAFVTGGSGFVGRNLIPALCEAGYAVRALARSDKAAAAVVALGAEAARGDLDDPKSVEALRAQLAGADVVFHAAAQVNDWLPAEEAYRTNVTGTRALLDAARAAGVPRFVHVSTEAVLLGAPIVNADESQPRAPRPIGEYARTKGLAEDEVLAANAPGFTTLILRPRLIWGRGDTTLLPRFVAEAKAGRLVWVGGGKNLTSTCHVRNLCEALLRAAERGTPGAIYFITDGEPTEFRPFISALLRTQGVAPPKASVPRFPVHALAWAGDALFRALRLRAEPPLSHAAFHLMFDTVTVDDARARRELGYVGRVTRDEGFSEMAADAGRNGQPSIPQ